MRSPLSLVARIPARMVVGAISIYQKLVSPNLSPNCRYQPSCSQYMVEAVRRFGALKGIWLGARRIGRCHPLHEGGFDPVPERWPSPSADLPAGLAPKREVAQKMDGS